MTLKDTKLGLSQQSPAADGDSNSIWEGFRRHLLWTLAPACAVVFLNQLIETYVLSQSRLVRTEIGFGFFRLIVQATSNHGLALNLFSDPNIQDTSRWIHFSTIGGFIIFGYIALNFILPVTVKHTRLGFALIFGGILGNIFDRIRFGYVWDYWALATANTVSPIFNFNDLCQWLGYGVTIFFLAQDWPAFWPEKQQRARRWVDPQFQFRYCAILLMVGGGFFIISGIFSLTFLRTVLAPRISKPDLEIAIGAYLREFYIVGGAFFLCLIALGKYLSHRAAGPVYAFQRYVEDLIGGKSREFRLRQGDDFRHLEKTAKLIQNRLQGDLDEKS